MTQTEVLLAAVIVAGFALLALTVAAFAFSRELAGVVVLVGAGACFVLALVLMGRVSSAWQEDNRAAVVAKYDVHVQQWGAPLGSAPKWKVDGEIRTECAVELDHADAPVFTCDGQELPLR